MKKDEILKDDELVKALEILNIDINDIADKETEAETEIEKAKKKEEKEKIKAEETEEAEEESEGEKEEGDEEEEVEEKVEKGKKNMKKSEEVDLLKSFETMLTNFSNDQKTTLDKLSNRMSDMEAVVSKMANQPVGRKANTHFIEKSFGEETIRDDKGMKVLSMSQHKPAIEKAMEDIMMKSTDSSIKSRYESAILTLNAGCGMPSQEIALDMYNNHKIRLVK